MHQTKHVLGHQRSPLCRTFQLLARAKVATAYSRIRSHVSGWRGLSHKIAMLVVSELFSDQQRRQSGRGPARRAFENTASRSPSSAPSHHRGRVERHLECTSIHGLGNVGAGPIVAIPGPAPATRRWMDYRSGHRRLSASIYNRSVQSQAIEGPGLHEL
jgi:hypothetical protein